MLVAEAGRRSRETVPVSRMLACLILLVPLVAAGCGGATSGRTTVATTTQAPPPIVIESPAAGAVVPAAFHVKGTASVFEATLVVELVVDGKVVIRKTVTASEGAPARGRFDTLLHAPSSGPARVVAFSPSAKNGEPQHRVEAPVTVR